MSQREPKIKLVLSGPGIDAETQERRRVLARMQTMTPDQLFELAVRAGIYTEDGKLTRHYRKSKSSAPAVRATVRSRRSK